MEPLVQQKETDMLGGAIVKDFIEYFGGAIEQPDGRLKDITGAVSVNVGSLVDWGTGCSTCGYSFAHVDLTFYDKDKRKLAGYKGADLTDFFRFVYDRSHGQTKGFKEQDNART